MSITAIRKLGMAEGAARELYKTILEIPQLQGRSYDVTSAEILERIMHLMVDATGTQDPFHEIKDQQNKRIMEIVPFLRNILKEARDPLYTAVKLAILGNTIDLMMGDRPTDIENSITERLKAPLSEAAYAYFRQRLDESNLLVYLGDNAGEIVFDKLLMETIKEMRDTDIVFVVRSVPTLNDATVDEARSVGIHEIATVVENGIDGPCPGTILHRCSEEVKERIKHADMIISKGGGNFDTLDEERKGGLDKPISFMFLSKCEPYSEYLGIELGLPILTNAF